MSEPNISCPYRLDTCVWELTLACPFRCAHCGSSAGRALPGQLSLDEALDVARQLGEMRCRRVALMGGEVFLFRGWHRVAHAMASAGVEVSVITNGACFTTQAWEELSESGVWHVSLSIDGCRDAHDSQRERGSFDTAIAALAELKHRGYVATAITTLTRDNCADLEELYDVLRAAGSDAWQLQLYSPISRESSSRVPTDEQTREVIRFVARIRAQEGAGARMPVFAADNVGYFTSEEKDIRLLPGRCFMGCSAGLSSVGIDSCGNVAGCESLRDPRFIEGNLRERSLRSIWEDPNAFAYNRHFSLDKLEGRCATCDAAPLCAGGCRSTNFYRTGSLMHTGACVRDGADVSR